MYHIMATKEPTPDTAQPDNAGKENAGTDASDAGTFETDISETGEDGTTVRQAEVSEQDLREVKPDSERSSQKDERSSQKESGKREGPGV
jgi:hypothetical protein